MNNNKLAQLVKTFLPSYRAHHHLNPQQASVCQSIIQCRTEALGGVVQVCSSCGYNQTLYHSCRNRHCPQCQQYKTQAWCDQQMGQVLPVDYYHLVFTLHHALNVWAQWHPKTIYRLLFKAAWATLQKFSDQGRHLTGQLGATFVLHTWGQAMDQHIHLHVLVPGGALSEEGKHWRSSKKNYLYPVRALSRVFRGKMVSFLRQAWEAGIITEIAHQPTVPSLLNTLMAKDWVVYSKPHLRKPETIVRYLSRYTQKIAIDAHRIVETTQTHVSFRWKDYADGNQQKVMTITGEEFLRRFLLHVLPAGFMKVRHYGFLANCVKTKKLEQIRRCLAAKAPQRVVKPPREDLGVYPCPKCRKLTLVNRIEILARGKRTVPMPLTA